MDAQSLSNMSAWERLKLHPRGFWFVFWGELAERASYYGMRTILALFLLDIIHFDQGKSGFVVQIFMASCYMTPLIGGFIADRFLGKFRTIIYFSLPYILGHVLLGSARAPEWIYVALALLAMGVGTIKPNVTPLMAAMYEREGKEAMLTEAFSYFYAAVNIGGFITSWVLPRVRDHYGYTTAFITPTVLMVVATGIFAYGKKYYVNDVVKKRAPKTAAQKKSELDTLKKISGVFMLIVAFWLVYDQSVTTWIFFARDHMNLNLWPFSIVLSPDQVQALNPLFIVLLTPAFIWFWNYLGKKEGKPVPSTRKMMVGFVFTFLCMLAMAIAGFLSMEGKVSVWWEVVATFVITISELCVSVVGLEFAYSVASPETKSTVTAAFLFTIFAGDFLAGFLAKIYPEMNPGVYFGLQTLIVGLAGIAFYFVGRKFERLAARANQA